MPPVSPKLVPNWRVRMVAVVETVGVIPVPPETLIPVPAVTVMTTAPVAPFTLVTGAPGIHAPILVLVIVGAPVAVLQVACRSMACVAVVSMVQVAEVCIGASPGVRVAPVPTKMQLAI